MKEQQMQQQMFGAPKAPTIPAPVVMPTENSTAVLAAQQTEAQKAAALSGRASTFMGQTNNAGTDTTMGGN